MGLPLHRRSRRHHRRNHHRVREAVAVQRQRVSLAAPGRRAPSPPALRRCTQGRGWKARAVHHSRHERFQDRNGQRAAIGEGHRMSLTGLIWFLLIGLIAGWLAGKVMRGGGFGLVGDLIVGIIGALLGGWLFGVIGIHAGGLIGAIVTAFVGAVLLLLVLRLIKRA